MSATESTQKASWKQMLALATFIAGVLGEMFNAGQIQYWLQNKTKLKAKIRELFDITETYSELREEWQKFYQSVFGIEIDFTGVTVPERPEGNYRLLFIAKGLTPNKVYDAWTFPKRKYSDDLDKAVPINKRTATESYAIWVLAGDEPDAEFLGKSTNNADPTIEIGMTLLERMIFESKYFAETGKNLDVKGSTFCSGSRHSGGDVPHVYRDTNDNKVYVDWYSLDDSNSKYGVRRAVS